LANLQVEIVAAAHVLPFLAYIGTAYQGAVAMS
jgi:hypothetical protein